MAFVDVVQGQPEIAKFSSSRPHRVGQRNIQPHDHPSCYG